jgi:hypothetical protein
MTEISIVFLSKLEETLEQMTGTVGFVQGHIEVSFKMATIWSHIWSDFSRGLDEY